MKIFTRCLICVAVAATLCLGTTANAATVLWSSGQAGGSSDWVTGGSWLDAGGVATTPGLADDVFINPNGQDVATGNDPVWPVVALGDTVTVDRLFMNRNDDPAVYSSPTSTSLTVYGTLDATGTAPSINRDGSTAVPAIHIPNVRSSILIDGGSLAVGSINGEKGRLDIDVLNGGLFTVEGDFRPGYTGPLGSTGTTTVDATSSVVVTNRWRVSPGAGHEYVIDLLGNADTATSGSLLIQSDFQANDGANWVTDLIAQGNIRGNGNIGAQYLKRTLIDNGGGDLDLLIEAVPEPASLALLGLGLLSMVGVRRRS